MTPPTNSNSLDFLKQNLPAYRGEKHHPHSFCVSDSGLITAPGSAPVSFAAAVLRALHPDQGDMIQNLCQQFAAEFMTGASPVRKRFAA